LQQKRLQNQSYRKIKEISFFEKNSGPLQKLPIFGIFSPINLKIWAIKPANFVLFLVVY